MLFRSPAVDQPPTTLKRGKYLVKVYVDTNGRLADDPALLLDEKDFFGQAEIKNARWREGFRQAEKVVGSLLKRD